MLSPQDLADALNDDSFSDVSLALLSHSVSASERFLFPSLSIIKPAHLTARVASSSAEVLDPELWGVPAPRQWLFDLNSSADAPIAMSDVLRFFQSQMFSCQNFYSRDTTIVVSPANQLDRRIRQELAIAAQTVRNASLHLINASRERTQKELIKVRDGFDLDHTKTLSSLCKFLQDKYDVHTAYYSLTYTQAGGVPEWHMGSSDSDASWLHIRDKLPAMSVLEKKLPLYIKASEYYFLFVPFCSPDDRTLPRSVLVVSSSAPVSKYIAENVHRFVTHYFSTYLPEQRIRLLEDMNSGAINLINGALRDGSRSQINIWQEIKTRAKVILEAAVVMSNAFSATLRLYDPFVKGLRLFAESGVPRSVDVGVSSLISLSQAQTSINAKTFLNAPPRSPRAPSFPERGLYEPDLSSLRRNVSGKYPILPEVSYRPNAQSELCLVLYYKSTKIGVLNFESPDKDGLAHDIPDLERFRDSLEQFITLALESSDKYWLAGRSQHYQNWHELADEIASADLPQDFQKKLEDYLNIEMAIAPSDTLKEMTEITDFFDDYCQHYSTTFSWEGLGSIGSDLEADLRHAVQMNFEDNSRIPKYTLDMVLVILKNLLDNMRKYSDPSRMQLHMRERKIPVAEFEIDHRAPPNRQNRKPLVRMMRSVRILEIRMSGRPMLEDTDLPFVFYSPLRPLNKSDQSDRKSASYGLFIVGVLARQLGGFAWAANFESTSSHSILIQIPLP